MIKHVLIPAVIVSGGSATHHNDHNLPMCIANTRLEYNVICKTGF